MNVESVFDEVSTLDWVIATGTHPVIREYLRFKWHIRGAACALLILLVCAGIDGVAPARLHELCGNCW